MTNHEDRVDDDRDDGEHEWCLSPSEALATLVDGALTEGDIKMLMELRVGLREHPAGPAKVVEDA